MTLSFWAVGAPAASYTLCGGPTPSTPIWIDDGIDVNLNGTTLYTDPCHQPAGFRSPVPFQAEPGAVLTITGVYNVPDGQCEIGPLWLHNNDNNASKQLYAGGFWPAPSRVDAEFGSLVFTIPASLGVSVPSSLAAGVVVGNVTAGQTYVFVASGCAGFWPENNYYSDANGNVYSNGCGGERVGGGWIGNDNPCPDAVALSLVGKVGGQCIQLGERVTFVAPTTGPLVVLYNDSNHSDNSGGLNVRLYPLETGPLLSNVRASPQPGTKLVNITYDVADGDSSRLDVTVAVSMNNGTSYDLPASSFSGDGYGANVTPGNNRQITWNAGADWNNNLSSQVRFRVTASDGSGSSSADSVAVLVDTRNTSDRPVVQDVRSQYCSGNQHAYFLNGVSLNQTFTVVLNWNGKTPDSIKFIGPWGTHPQSGTQTTRPYNVGTDFGVGGTLAVVLVASDGTESLPYRVNFDVINPPSGIPSGLFYVKPLAATLTYATPEYSFNVLDSNPSEVDEDVPIFGGEKLGFLTAAKASAEVQGDGTASASVSVGTGSKIELAGFEVVPRFTGRPEWEYLPTTGQWRAAGYVGLEASASMSTPPAYVWAVPPVYFRADVDIDTAVLFGVAGWDAQNKPLLNGMWDCSVQVSGVAACGASGFLAVEGYLGGGPFWTVQYPQQPTLKELGVELNGGVRVVALLWTWDAGLLHYEWYLVGPSPAAQLDFQRKLAQQLNAADTSQFKLMSRDYLWASTPYSTFLTRKPGLLMWGDPVIPKIPLTLQTNIFPYSDPALALSGTNRLLLFVTDNTNRAPENRTELLWSKWNGSTWVNPTSVWNDATADFAPTVKLFPNGSAVAAWANEKVVLTNNAPLSNALAGLEIAAALFDPVAGLWTAANLTSDDYLDRSPQLAAAANGKALLTWISNPGNSVLGATNALNTIQSRLWDGATWEDAGNIVTNAGMLLWSTVAYDGTNGVFLAAIDSDDDQSTIDDQELWGATFDGASWSALARLTTNAVQDTKPQAVFDSAGRLLVVWYQNTNLVMRVGDLNLGSPTVVGQLSGASSQKDFHLVTGPAGQISLVWEDMATDGSGPDPMLLNYDAALAVWSQPLRLLANTNQLERTFSGAYADNGHLLMAYNSVAVSHDTNNVPQFGQVDLMFLDYAIGSDLAVSSGDIGLSTNNPAPGQSVDVTALVRNSGELALTNVQVAFYDGNPASGGSMIGSTQTVAGMLEAGGSATVQVSWVVPLSTTNRTLYVMVDPAQAQSDRNRANNTATRSVLAADLQISDITVLQPSATNRILNARCVNLGVIPSGSAVDVVFRRGAANGPVLATVPIANLPTNGVYDASFEWNLAGVTFTNAFELVYATVDVGNVVAEADEGNNTRIVSVMTSLDSDADGLLDGEEASYGTNPLSPDTDGDGLSDFAELRTHGTNPLLKDTDGDGMSDGQEIAAGTDPSSAASMFKISSVVRNPDGSVTLQWQSVTNKMYRLNRSLTPARGGYSTLTNGIPGTPPVNTFTDTTATNAAAFYWVELQ